MIKKRFDIQIDSEGQSVSKTFELDKTIKNIRGILLTSDKDDMLYFRGSQKIEVNKEEVFPEDYESKLLMSGINVAPSQRYYDLGIMPVGNGQIKLSYVDRPDGRSFFEPYRVSLYVDCELETAA